ncbi:2-hydroxychromene-2-carboxylate isomerase [Alcanivorax sp. ALC70]|nr:2-hydroxychromene-2-carboxylate isomerase [Alcanivorax sp. ALC70]
MTDTLEFFFDVGSPASYLAWTQLPALAERTGAVLRYRPMLLGGVFKATGNASPAAVPAKGRYTHHDMQRFARRYGITLTMNPHFPVNTLMGMRLATAALDTEHRDAMLTALFEGCGAGSGIWPIRRCWRRPCRRPVWTRSTGRPVPRTPG